MDSMCRACAKRLCDCFATRHLSHLLARGHRLLQPPLKVLAHPNFIKHRVARQLPAKGNGKETQQCQGPWADHLSKGPQGCFVLKANYRGGGGRNFAEHLALRILKRGKQTKARQRLSRNGDGNADVDVQLCCFACILALRCQKHNR